MLLKIKEEQEKLDEINRQKQQANSIGHISVDRAAK